MLGHLSAAGTPPCWAAPLEVRPCEHLTTGKRKERESKAEHGSRVLSGGITAAMVKVVPNFTLQGSQLIVVSTWLYSRYGTGTVTVWELGNIGAGSKSSHELSQR